MLNSVVQCAIALSNMASTATVVWHKWVPKMRYVIALSSSLFTVKLQVNCKRKNNIPWHTVNLHGLLITVFFYSIHSQCFVPEADHKIYLFSFLLLFFSIFNLRHAIYRIHTVFFPEDLINYLPTLHSNFGKFWTWFRELKKNYFLLWGQMSPVLDHAYL